MRLYTADEISKLLEEFGNYKLNSNDQRESMDYMSTVQVIARAIDDFLEEYGRQQKKSTFFGLFQCGDDEE